VLAQSHNTWSAIGQWQEDLHIVLHPSQYSPSDGSKHRVAARLLLLLLRQRRRTEAADVQDSVVICHAVLHCLAPAASWCLLVVLS